MIAIATAIAVAFVVFLLAGKKKKDADHLDLTKVPMQTVDDMFAVQQVIFYLCRCGKKDRPVRFFIKIQVVGRPYSGDSADRDISVYPLGGYISGKVYGDFLPDQIAGRR